MTKFKNSILSRTLQEVNDSKKSYSLMSDHDLESWATKDCTQFNDLKNVFIEDKSHEHELLLGIDLSREEKLSLNNVNNNIKSLDISEATSEPFVQSHEESQTKESGLTSFSISNSYPLFQNDHLMTSSSSLTFRPTPVSLSGNISAITSNVIGLNYNHSTRNLWNQLVPNIVTSPYETSISSVIDSPSSALVLPSLKKTKRQAQPIPDNCKDDSYWERRKRNNESAKRSREMRRLKEQQTTMKVIYLEQENLRLKTEVSMLRIELEKFRFILYRERKDFSNNNANDHKILS